MAELLRTLESFKVRALDSERPADAITESYQALTALEAFADGGRVADQAEPLDSIITDLLTDMRHAVAMFGAGQTTGQAIEALKLMAGDDRRNPERAYRAVLAIADTFAAHMPQDMALADVVAFVRDAIGVLCKETDRDFHAMDATSLGHFSLESGEDD